MACAYSEDSNQFAHMQSLISLSFPLEEMLGQLSTHRAHQRLIRLHKYAALFESSMGLHVNLYLLLDTGSGIRHLSHDPVFTVLPAKSDSDVMFCLQSYHGLIMDIALLY